MSWKSFFGALPYKSYTVRMDRKHRRLTMRYTNPGDPSFPPSFVLKVEGDVGTLQEGKKKLTGRANWQVL